MTIMTMTTTPNVAADAIDWVRRAHDLGPQIAAARRRGRRGRRLRRREPGALKAAGLPHRGGARRAGRRRRQPRRAGRDAADAGAAIAARPPWRCRMHTHVVALPAWRWRRTPEARRGPAEAGRGREADPGLQRRLGLAGGLRPAPSPSRAASASAARKVFASGSPERRPADDHGGAGRRRRGPTVLHMAIPLRRRGRAHRRHLAHAGHARHRLARPGARRRLRARRGGHRAAGRPGKWHPIMHMVTLIAFPLIYERLCRPRRGGAGRRRWRWRSRASPRPTREPR